MGWIQKIELHADAKGRRRHSYRAGFRDPDGRICTKQFPRRHDADDWLRTHESAIHRGDYVDPALGREGFGDFLEHTLRTGDLRPKTLLEYRALMRRHVLPEWQRRQINAIRPSDVKELLARIGERTGAETVHAVYRVLRRTLQIAVDEGRLARNPAARLKVRRGDRRDIRYLSPEELAALAETVDDRHRVLVLVLGYGGLRIGEASALRVGDVDTIRGRLTIERSAVEVDGQIVTGPTKTGGARAVFLPASVRDALIQHLAAYSIPDDPKALVFTGARGRPIRATLFGRRVIAPAARKLGIDPPPRTHDLRHTAAALAIRTGAHPKAIQEQLGHSSIRTTLDVYGHLFPGLHEETAEALDLLAVAAAGERGEVVELRGG